MKRTEPPADLLTSAQLAREAGIHPQTLKRLIDSGKIEPCASTLTRVKLFKYSAISAVSFIANNPRLRSVLY